jgi:hypothetical protein
MLAASSFLIELRVYWELLDISQGYIQRERKETANTPTQIGPINIASFLLFCYLHKDDGGAMVVCPGLVKDQT